jgi:hypothetical protein
MAKLVTYKCPVCGGKFDFLHHPSDEPPPDYCQIKSCGAFVGEPEKVPVLHLSLKTKHSKVPDSVYRGMEAASEARAADAAEMLGVDKKEMSDLKITDMKDNTREGESQAMQRRFSEAERNLTTPTARPTMQGASSGWGTADVSGPGAGSTRNFINSQQNTRQFDQIAAAVTAKGMMGKHVPSKG